MASASCRQSTVGRVHHKGGLAPAPAYTSDMNSFCLPCGHWHFGAELARCARCGAAIFRWVTKDDLKFFASRSSLHGF